MPVKTRNIKNGKYKGKYRVSTPHGVKAKGTTKEKADALKRLLNAVEHSDWRPTKKKKRKK